MAEEKRELLLRAKDISIVFGGLKAVSDFSLDLYEGELIGLIGPNGAGKTTVFNMLSGVYKPTSGTITFVDKKGTLQVINKKTPAQLNRIGIARTFQNIRLFGGMTVRDNIKIALHQSRGVNPFDVEFRSKKFRHDEEMMNAKVEHLLGLFHMEKKIDELAKNLPYGEQRKLEICRALASGPKLLLLDEPVSALDPAAQEEMYRLIADLHKSGITIIMISHDVESSLRYATHVLHIGDEIFFGTKAAFIHESTCPDCSGQIKRIMGVKLL